jgi:hypothetical protein
MRAVRFLFCFFMPVLVAAGQQAASKPPHLNLTSDGHACSGSFTLTSKRVSWKSSFSNCRALPYQVISGKQSDWLLGIEKNQACPFSVLHLTQKDPQIWGTMWNVDGYESLESYRQDANNARLSCTLQ